MHRSTQYKRQILAGVALATLAGVSSAIPAAIAQDTQEEVIVTAQRRAENIQKVPVSITAFSGRRLQELGIDRPIDLTMQTPNVGVFTIFGDAQQPSFSIRGISLLSFSDSFEPPIGMYVDDVYVGSGVGQSMQLFDIERVEVLRGPQGTLFGRNTTGGLFSITSRRPTAEFSLDATAQYSSYDDVMLELAMGGPISEHLRYRIAGRYNNNEGWSKGFLDGRRYDDVNTVAVRGSLEADLGDAVKALLVLSYGKADQATPGFGITGFLDPLTGAECSVARIRSGECAAPSIGNLTGNDLGGFRPGRTPGQSAASFGNKPHQKVETFNAAFHVNADLGDGLSLTSITGFGTTEKDYFEDLVVFSDGFTMEAEQFTQEIRLDGGTGPVTWVAGMYYFNDDKDLGSFDPTPVFGFSTDANQLTESWAVFGQARWAVNDKFGITAGGRYTDETKDLHYTTDFGIDETRSQSDGQFTWRAGIDYQMTPETMLYANVSTGYKSGGFNAQFVFAPDGVNPVDPETIISYEAGLKTIFWDGRARFNASAFFYRYDDIQLGIFVNLPSGGFATRLRNAGDVEGKGAEFDLQVTPIDNLDIRVGAGFVDTEFVTSAIIVSAGQQFDTKGQGLPMTPPVTLNGSIRYTIPMEGGDELWFQADGTWRDKHYFTIDESEREGSSSYGLLNLRAGWNAEGETWGIEAFVENVSDEEYLLFAADQTSDLGVVTWGKPLWAGIAIRARY
jgi:iron complex outermembrane receptor protein